VASQRTKLLALVALAAAVLAAFAYGWQDNRRVAAEGAQRDLAITAQDLADLARWNAGAGTDATLTADDPELNRRLRTAAVAAGVPDQLSSIDPGQPRQIPQSDYSETLVFLRLNSVTLRQLVTFLHGLSAADSSVRTKSLELAPPAAGVQPVAGGETGAPDDQWTADVTLAYLTYSPRSRSN
jgi:hypothetical protein